MKVLVVLAHPNPRSLNHAIAETVCRSLKALEHNVFFHDLYGEKFDPVLPVEELNPNNDLPDVIQKFSSEIEQSQGMIFIHPNWWGNPPAILGGWIDRVLRTGFAYRFTASGPVPLLGDKKVQIFSTSNTPRDVEVNVYHDPLENFWKTIVFGLCGCESFERRNFESVVLSNETERHRWLAEVDETIQRRFKK